MKKHSEQFDSNISRLVKLSGDSERPSEAFTEKLIGEVLKGENSIDPTLETERQFPTKYKRDYRISVAVCLLVAVPFCALFYDILFKIVRRWIVDPTWSHGFLIPLFSFYLLYQKKDELFSLVPKPNYVGLLGLLLCIAFYPIDVFQFQIAYFEYILVIPALISIVLFLGGWKILRTVWLPIAYLFFAIPLPDRFYKGIIIPLRLFAADISSAIISWIPGIETTANGTVIDVLYRSKPYSPPLDVAEACSGMRLLMAFLALGVAMAFLHRRFVWQRIVLVLTTIPIAILCNVVRVIITVLICIFLGSRYAQGFYHDMLGLLMLPLAFGLYGAIAWFMSSLFTEEEEKETAAVQILRRKGGEERVSKPQDTHTPLQEPLNRFDTLIPARVPFLQMPFLICIGVLTVSAFGMKTAMHRAYVQAVKLPIPLQKPFDQLDTKLLAPYQVIKQDKITNLDVLESLGTRDYIQWILEDPEVPAESPVRYCSMFITYHTGNPDHIPHVPDGDYVGSGPIQKGNQSLLLRLSVTDVTPAELPIRRLVFAYKTANTWDPQTEFSVLYFFKANGQYADGRTGVRFIMGKNFTCKYSYFSKVEWKFSGTSSSPSEEDIVKASEKLMSVLLPILETQHWPDWEKAKQEAVSKP